MTDHGLDLAVIGNGRTAALIDPTGCLVMADRVTTLDYPRRYCS
jgi:hypothetical protein